MSCDCINHYQTLVHDSLFESTIKIKNIYITGPHYSIEVGLLCWLPRALYCLQNGPAVSARVLLSYHHHSFSWPKTMTVWMSGTKSSEPGLICVSVHLHKGRVCEDKTNSETSFSTSRFVIHLWQNFYETCWLIEAADPGRSGIRKSLNVTDLFLFWKWCNPDKMYIS